MTLSNPVANVNRYTVESWVDNAVIALTGSLGQWNHLVYALPLSVDFQGAAAYAYMNSFKSVFMGDYVSRMGVQMHELGHNLWMRHSGYGTATYLDHTGLMGTFDFPPQIIAASF